jgi:hypothetical protein
MNQAIKELRSSLNFFFHTINEDDQNIKIDEIQKQQSFLKENEWIILESFKKLGCTALAYFAKKGQFFGNHTHEGISEHLVIKNKKGKIRIVTPKYDTVLEYPNSFLIEKGLKHKVYFLEDTEVICMFEGLSKNDFVLNQ